MLKSIIDRGDKNADKLDVLDPLDQKKSIMEFQD
jgi:hypothetical protein